MKLRKTTNADLSQILEEGEGYTIEFKESVNTDLGKEFVAFANASGGRILIGVSDEGKIVGCDDSNKILSQIQDVAASCDPAVAIQIEKIIHYKILVIHVLEGANRPHRCNKGFYLRSGANSQKMSTSDITEFIHSEGNVRFDKQLRLDLNWENEIDFDRLSNFLSLSGLKDRKDKSLLLTNLGAGQIKNENFYLNHTGVLFFAKQPIQILPQACVLCALFKGNDRTTILDRKNFTCNLIENVDDALIYLKQHLNLRFEITGETARRKEILELPEVALREALVNAVTHRDYFEEGANVVVEIFDNRVDIYNPGGLPKGLPLSQFGERSVCRNPLIANMMLRCDYIEKMGTGIRRMQEALKIADCPELQIETKGIFTLSFTRKLDLNNNTKGPSRDQVGTKSVLSQNQLSILLFCRVERSLASILEHLDRSNRTKFRDQVIKPLLEAGFLEMTIPDKPNSPLQMYRTTNTGKVELAK